MNALHLTKAGLLALAALAALTACQRRDETAAGGTSSAPATSSTGTMGGAASGPASGAKP